MHWPRSSLYMRTAVHIGIALAAFIVLGAAALASIAAYELRGYVETRHSSLGIEAAEILASGNRDALEQWLQTDAAIPDDVSIFILDKNSQDILGRQIPDAYAEFIKTSVIEGSDAASATFRPVRLAPELVGPDNERYFFLVLPKGISLWGSPATLLGLGIAALLVIASVAWLIARSVGRPIGELQLAVGELSAGHTDARVPATIAERNDELGDLAASFNSMADQLESLISGREQLMREMSHELRSPLTRLQTAIALAAQTDSLADAERARIDLEIQRMNHVIGEMLRYSSLDVRVKMRRRLVRIGKLLTELVDMEQVEAAGRRCQNRQSAEKNLIVVGDPELLKRGFENVLRNAIRFAPPDSTVEISARYEADNIIVEISDRGPGIATAELTKIFEPYYRSSKNNDKSIGTGLGLAIVNRVFARHAGNVIALHHDGGGLTLRISIPAAELT
jgi:two-component system OmpR family sensor kinase